MRNFEKITFERFKEEINTNLDIYNSYKLPERATKYSAGYDFYAIEDIVIKPNEIIKIPTGYKAYFGEDEVLFLIIRSSISLKHNIKLYNQVGVIDSDYYNNETNEGHIYVQLITEGKEAYTIKKDSAYLQAVFCKYLTAINDRAKEKRRGGFGSTERKEKTDEII